ncbi:hypothetical protein GOQ27_00935 [Clostridium sp. D2Q-11]|uniref:Uncharacterized protein n=1 Tax=Anaeromonas frigoriresistens TaxID=2683708 RepID=A0A942UUH0_9FIRM|nr:hypothetical protein [Anaeromonas frigoriresistens]MBS4537004.1 hypothetical protein [Anaeromonas frigoriresistens]
MKDMRHAYFRWNSNGNNFFLRGLIVIIAKYILSNIVSEKTQNILIIISVVFILSIAIYIKNESKEFVKLEHEVMWISTEDSIDLIKVTDKSRIYRILDNIGNVSFEFKYANREFDVDLDNPDYKIKLDNSKQKVIILQMWLWKDEESNKLIIFNTEGRYGYIREEDKLEMINLLKRE